MKTRQQLHEQSERAAMRRCAMEYRRMIHAGCILTLREKCDSAVQWMRDAIWHREEAKKVFRY